MTNPIKFSRNTWWWVGIILLLAILTAIWFAIFRYRTFMGDDLRLIFDATTGGYGSSFLNALTTSAYVTYRPVYAAFFHLESLLFGINFRSYIYLNIFLEFLNACLVSYICYRLSRKQPFVALVSGILFIVSRFSYYNVLWVIGGMMGLALFLFLLLIIMAMRAYETNRPISLLWPLLLYFLLIFTYEGYIVVAGFLVIAILLAPISFKSYYHRISLAAVPLAILAFNYLLKTYILQIRFFQGTSFTPIKFDPHQFFYFMLTGFANMLGFNAGPDYLSGLNIFSAGRIGFIIGGIFAVFIVTLVLVYIYRRFRTNNKIGFSDIRNILLILALFVPLLVSASITIRQEYRWLYAPYCLVLFVIAYLSMRISSSKWLSFMLIVCILASAVTVDTFYRGYLHNLFFIDGMRVADSARNNIIDKYGSSLSQKEFFLVGASSDIESWYFIKNTFFKFYTGDPQVRMQYVDNIDDIKKYQVDVNSILVFSFNSITREFNDITQKARDTLVSSPDFLNEPKYDFLAEYEYGKINNTQKVSTPSGYGVFTMTWTGDLGSIKTLTIISGFSYTYDKVLIKDGDSLSFMAGIPLEGGDGALDYIDFISTDGVRSRIFKTDLLPATEKGIKWESFLVPCSDYAGKEISITFGVESSSENQVADWVAIGSPLLLAHR